MLCPVLLRKMNGTMPPIRRGSPTDLSAIEALLQNAGLPTEDIRSIPELRTWVVEGNNSLRGAIALEPFADEGLLRSLAVAPDARSQGLGRRLVAQLESDARIDGVRKLVLLTQTAEKFFAKLGYQVVNRDQVSDLVRTSAQFRALCPASATCMVKVLTHNVLFLCTGNSARSILAESLLNQQGRGRFRGFSAGSHPKGEVHPIALALLKQLELPSADLRSKSWDEFAAPGAPPIHFVITVCDNAAGEVCPIWPGKPMTAHWGIPDPAAVEGTDAQKWEAFRTALQQLEHRIRAFVSLPIGSLERVQLKSRLDEIGLVGIGRAVDQGR